MQIETKRLLIRDIKTNDAVPFAIMAADGTLNDCGFDKDCSNWITEWITEAKNFALRNNPNKEQLAYTISLKDGAAVVGSVGCSYYEDLRETGITYFVGAQYRNNGYAVEAVKAYTEYFLKCYNAKRIIATVRNENVPSWKVIEKAGYILNTQRMYKDLNDAEEELYRFYEIKQDIKRNHAECVSNSNEITTQMAMWKRIAIFHEKIYTDGFEIISGGYCMLRK